VEPLPGQSIAGEAPLWSNSRYWFAEYCVLCSTLDTAYRQVLTSLEETAQAHITFADNLINEVANELKAVEKRKEDTKKVVRTFPPRFLPPQSRTGLTKLLTTN